jgi:hypothetical protein
MKCIQDVCGSRNNGVVAKAKAERASSQVHTQNHHSSSIGEIEMGWLSAGSIMGLSPTIHYAVRKDIHEAIKLA